MDLLSGWLSLVFWEEVFPVGLHPISKVAMVKEKPGFCDWL
jgi:hypothetical protein